MIGEDDFATFFDTAAFARGATFLPSEGGTYAVAGIFTEAHALAVGVSASAPVFTVAETVSPRLPRQGDGLTIDGKGDFTIADLQPDGSGLVRLILERA